MSINTYRLLKDVGFSESRIKEILPRIKSHAYEADQAVWIKGDEHQSFAYISRGLVCASKPCGGNVLSPVNIFGEGTWFGEAGFIDFHSQSSGFDFICLAPTRLISIPFDDAIDAFEQEAEFTRYIARLTNWRCHHHSEMLMLMRFGSAALRVVMGLAMLAEAMINNSSHVPKHLLEDHLEIPLKQSLLACMCGVSRGILSNSLQQLTVSGWLQVSYGTIEIRLVKTWLVFLTAQRQNSKIITKPSMQDLLVLMQVASTNADELQCQSISIQ